MLSAHAATHSTSAPIGWLAPQVLPQKTYTESFTGIFWQAEGQYVQVTLLISNLGWQRQNALCQVFWVHNEQRQVFTQQVATADWSYTPATTAAALPTGTSATNTLAGTLQIGACCATASAAQLDFVLPFKEATFHLRLTPKPPLAAPVTPPGHPVYSNERFYNSQIVVAASPATLEVHSPNNAAPKTLLGFGYVDHARSTTLPRDLAYGWLRFRAFTEQCHTLLLSRFVTPASTHAAAQLAAYVWQQDRPAPRALRQASINLPAADTPATAVQVHVEEAGQPLFVIQGQQRWRREAPLEAYGFLGKLLGSVVGHLVNETLRASIDDPHAAAPCQHLDGVLEIDHISP